VILAAVGLLNVIKVALATRFMTLRDASRSLMDFYHTTIGSSANCFASLYVFMKRTNAEAGDLGGNRMGQESSLVGTTVQAEELSTSNSGVGLLHQPHSRLRKRWCQTNWQFPHRAPPLFL